MNPEKVRDLTFRHHHEIQVEIIAEICTVEALLKELAIPVEEFRPEAQYALRRINAYRNEADGLSATIGLLENKIHKMDSNPSIQRILQLEAELKKSGTAQYISQLTRELRHLKSIHSQKISSRVSVQRELLQERLRLLRIWKSVLSDEIQVLEESRKRLIDRIVSLAQYADDPAILDAIRSQIQGLSSKKTQLLETKLDASKIPVANIHVLRETLKKQLKDIVQIEKVVEEKRQTLKSLNQIAIELETMIARHGTEMDSSSETKLSQASDLPDFPESSEPPPVEELEVPEYKHSRMAVRNRWEKQ